jgi:hypothetical protein
MPVSGAGQAGHEDIGPAHGAGCIRVSIRDGQNGNLPYGRFFETPHNENLILSSATGVGGPTNIPVEPV